MARSRLSESDKAMLAECRELVASLDAESLSMLNPGHETTMFEHSRREGHVPKKKRGGQLTDYSAMEIWLDLKVELHKHNLKVDRIWAMHLYLKRLVNA